MRKYIPNTAKCVLDVGCHTGMFGRYLKETGIDTVWGVEANSASASIATTRLDKVIVGYFSDEQVHDDFFDVIVFNDVLEHMPDPGSVLKMASKKLVRHGIIVASIPNIRHVDNLLHIIKEKDFRYESEGIRDTTHLRFFTKKSIPRLFEENGFRILSLDGINEYWWTHSIIRRAAFRLFPKYLEDTKYIQFAVAAAPIRVTSSS